MSKTAHGSDKKQNKIQYYRRYSCIFLTVGIVIVIMGAWIGLDKIFGESTVASYVVIVIVLGGMVMLLGSLWIFMILTLMYYESKITNKSKK